MAHDQQPSESVHHIAYCEFLETYRHHFELTVKVISVHVALVGTLIGYLFQADIHPDQRLALMGFLVGTALIPAIGSSWGAKWLRRLDASVNKRSGTLNLPEVPTEGFRLVISMTGIFNTILSLTGSVLLLYEVNR